MRKMKDSGIEWVGNIPADWSVTRIKYILDPSEFGIKCGPFGSALTGKVVSDGEIVIYGQWNIVNSDFSIRRNTVSTKDATSLESYNVQPDDVLVSMMGTIGRCAIVPEMIATGIMDSHVIKIRLDTNQILPQFFWYEYDKNNCNVVMEYFNRKKKGFIMDGLNTSIIKNAYLILPPIDEQCRIVSFLNKKCFEFDKLISNVQAQIEKLKAYKQSLIAEVVTKGLDQTAPMKDSGVEWIGVTPAHWTIIPSKFLFANCDERRRESDVQLTASQKYGMISQEDYMRRENARIVLADKGLENWKHVEPFDFVISLRSFQGGLEMSEVTGCATWHYIVLRARREIHPYYYKWLFKSSMYITALQRTCNYIRDGQDLRYSNFVKVPLCIPTLDEQRKIADFLDKKCAQIDRLIAIKQAKIEKLDQYKRSLIYEYVTGKREVS